MSYSFKKIFFYSFVFAVVNHGVRHFAYFIFFLTSFSLLS